MSNRLGGFRSLAVLWFAVLWVPHGALAGKAVSVPDWVRDAARRAVPTYSSETNAVVLLDETTYTVAPDGRATEHYRRVVKILRPQGRRGAKVKVSYDRDTPLTSRHIWSIGPIVANTLKDNEIIDVSSFG